MIKIKFKYNNENEELILQRDDSEIVISESENDLKSNEVFEKLFKIKEGEENTKFELEDKCNENEIDNEKIKNYYLTILNIITNAIITINNHIESNT